MFLIFLTGYELRIMELIFSFIFPNALLLLTSIGYFLSAIVSLLFSALVLPRENAN